MHPRREHARAEDRRERRSQRADDVRLPHGVRCGRRGDGGDSEGAQSVCRASGPVGRSGPHPDLVELERPAERCGVLHRQGARAEQRHRPRIRTGERPRGHGRRRRGADPRERPAVDHGEAFPGVGGVQADRGTLRRPSQLAVARRVGEHLHGEQPQIGSERQHRDHGRRIGGLPPTGLAAARAPAERLDPSRALDGHARGRRAAPPTRRGRSTSVDVSVRVPIEFPSVSQTESCANRLEDDAHDAKRARCAGSTLVDATAKPAFFNGTSGARRSIASAQSFTCQ